LSHLAIRVEGLGKKFRVAGPRERYRTLRDSLAAAASPGRLLRRRRGRGAEEFWALRDVSFEVAHGEVVGIIGRNGAGKSTLLKILSRITEPTTGSADLYGRVGSLLEVGTGFHPELSGRENIFLNGAILGMRTAEIAAKLDEIVAFAEVERFIDTPVKHYSSGMYLRLAFAVAAHLETEILLVDEVLAVGDMAFQEKCLGKMGDVAREGRTVLLVSHNMAAITSLCTSVLVIDSGRLRCLARVEEGVRQYMQSAKQVPPASVGQRQDRQGSGSVRITDVILMDQSGRPTQAIQCGSRAVFALSYASSVDGCLINPLFELKVSDAFGHLVFTLSTHLTGHRLERLPPQGVVYCEVPRMLATPDTYTAMTVAYANGEPADVVHDAFRFTVVDGDVFGSTRQPRKSTYGAVAMPHRWQGPEPDTQQDDTSVAGNASIEPASHSLNHWLATF